MSIVYRGRVVVDDPRVGALVGVGYVHGPTGRLIFEDLDRRVYVVPEHMARGEFTEPTAVDPPCARRLAIAQLVAMNAPGEVVQGCIPGHVYTRTWSDELDQIQTLELCVALAQRFVPVGDGVVAVTKAEFSGRRVPLLIDLAQLDNQLDGVHRLRVRDLDLNLGPRDALNAVDDVHQDGLLHHLGALPVPMNLPLGVHLYMGAVINLDPAPMTPEQANAIVQLGGVQTEVDR